MNLRKSIAFIKIICYNSGIHNSFTRKTGKFRSLVYVWGIYEINERKNGANKSERRDYSLAIGKGSNTAAKAYELAAPLAESLGLTLWDVVFEKEGAIWYLRIYLDKEGGVDINDCEAFSRPFNKLLDENDFIEPSYVFEAGSPGLGRELRRPEHFEKYLGEPVRVRFIRAVDNVREVAADLKAYSKESITLSANGEESEIKFSDIAFVRLCDDQDLFD